MKEKDRSFLHLFRLMIFGFSIIIIIVTIVTLLFYAKSKGDEANTTRDTSLLLSSANAFDSVIKQFHEVSIQLTSTPTLRKLVLTNYHSPGKNNSDTLSTLAIAKYQHSYLANIWLYDVRSGDVINDMYIECPLAESIYYPITQGYLDGSLDIEKLRYNGWFTSLFWYNEQLYIARDFPTFGEHRLGILFVRLDVKEILRDQTQNGLLYDQMVVFDANKQIISPLSSMGSVPTGVFSQMLDRNVDVMEKGSSKYILVKSELTGWYYGGEFQRYEVFSSDIVWIIGVLLLAFFAISSLFSHYIYTVFINPLEALAQSSRSYFDVTDKNEIEAISKSLSKSTQSLKEYDTAISSISSYLSESFFTDLYDGKPMSLNYIMTALNILDCQIDLSGFYWVMVVSYQDNTDLSFSSLISELVDKCIVNLNIDQLKYHISPYPNYTIILLELSLKIGTGEADVYRKFIFKNIVESLSSLPINMTVGNGTIVYSLTNIHASSEAAMLNRAPIEHAVVTEVPASCASDVEADLKENKVASFVKRLFELVDDNRLWQAEEDLKCQINFNYSNMESPDQFRESCSRLLLTVLDNAASSGILPNMLTDGSSEMFEITEKTSVEEARAKTLQLCLSCLGVKQSRNRKRNHQLVQTAKKYIDQHFCEPNLSLGTVADAIKTSSSYLSKMFKSSEGVSFVEYLNNKRVAYAKEQLRSSNLGIKEIATNSGFLSEQNFFRVFKRIVNTTPKQYRDAKKK